MEGKRPLFVLRLLFSLSLVRLRKNVKIRMFHFQLGLVDCSWPDGGAKSWPENVWVRRGHLRKFPWGGGEVQGEGKEAGAVFSYTAPAARYPALLCRDLDKDTLKHTGKNLVTLHSKTQEGLTGTRRSLKFCPMLQLHYTVSFSLCSSTTLLVLVFAAPLHS